MVNSFHNGLATFFELRPVLGYPGVFPGYPSNLFSCFDRLYASGSFLVAPIFPGLRSIILASQFWLSLHPGL